MISGILVMFTQFSQISDASMWKAVGEFAFIGLSFFVPFSVHLFPIALQVKQVSLPALS